MHQAMAAAYPSSLVPNAVSHGGYSPGQLASHGGRSPVSSPTPGSQPPPLSTPSHMSGYPGSGQITPGTGATPGAHNTSGNDGGMSSDCSDDEGSPGGPGGGGNVQIYPWMKKIHVAGAGNVSPRVSGPVCCARCPHLSWVQTFCSHKFRYLKANKM